MCGDQPLTFCNQDQAIMGTISTLEIFKDNKSASLEKLSLGPKVKET